MLSVHLVSVPLDFHRASASSPALAATIATASRTASANPSPASTPNALSPALLTTRLALFQTTASAIKIPPADLASAIMATALLSATTQAATATGTLTALSLWPALETSA